MNYELSIVIDILGALILIIYHFILYWAISKHPETTHIGKSNLMRGLWVDMVMSERKDILAVQTLRNWTMASTFLASTAILISLGSLSFSFGGGEISALSNQLALLEPASERFTTLKLLLISVTMFFAFFNFSLSIRYYNNAGYLINIPKDRYPEGTDMESVTTTLNKGGIHYNLGMRAYYLTAPLTLWLLGPVWFLMGSVLILLLLYRMDY